jgi:hypothetical protein
MAIATITARLQHWTAGLSSIGPGDTLLRELSSECELEAGDRSILGVPTRALVLKVFGIPYRDDPSALGIVQLHEDILLAVLHPHADVFSELWTRHVYGGPMPSTFQFSVHGEGDSWRRDLSWDGKSPAFLPIISARFSMRTCAKATVSET